jgi:hypothetical protein
MQRFIHNPISVSSVNEQSNLPKDLLDSEEDILEEVLLDRIHLGGSISEYYSSCNCFIALSQTKIF